MAAMLGRMSAAMAPPAPEVRDRAVALLSDAKLHLDSAAKLECLKELKDLAVHREPRLLGELLPHLMELWNDPASSVRNLLVEIIEEVGLRHLEHLPKMIPVLLALLRDESPAFARRAITTGTNLFRNTLEHVMLQGIYTRQVDKYLQDAWFSMQQFKDSVYPIAQQHVNDGVRLHAVKFIETVILLYTPDPSGPAQPPAPDRIDGNSNRINVAWIVSGHPLLNAAAMGQEASKILVLLISQLKTPEASSLPGPVAIVIVNSLAAIAKRRTSFYGRVLPGLLALAPNCESIKGAQVASVVTALKNAFLQLLKCSHAGPWRDRISNALRQMNAGDVAETALNQIERSLRNSDKDLNSRASRVKEERHFSDPRSNKRPPPPHENGGEEESYKRLRSTPPPPPPPAVAQQQLLPDAQPYSNGNGASLTPIQQMIQMFEALAAQGELAAGSIELLISKMPLDTLADLVMVNMHNLPPSVPSGEAVENPLPPPPPPPPIETMPVDVRRDPRRDPRRVDPRRPGPPLLVPKQEEMPVMRPVKLEPMSVMNSRDPRASLRVSAVKNEPTLTHVKVEPDEGPSAYGAAYPTNENFDDTVKTEQRTSIVSGSNMPMTRQQQSALGNSALLRILEGHKAIMAAGGGGLRIALLARLTSQSGEALDILQKHILADYASNMGHELALYALYELYLLHISEGESGSTLDKYESFFLSLSQGLKDSLPASDKSLSKLLCEIPLFPDGAFKLLESLCNPVSEPNNDRTTQGLSALWSLILQRPAVRERCLNMALECAVHEIEDIRTKAIRLIANKLYPVEYIMPKVEEFALQKLHSVLDNGDTESGAQESSTPQEGGEPQEVSVGDGSKASSASAQRYMSLYFALCTKKHALLGELLSVFAQSSKPVKQAIHRQIPVLVRTIGQSSADLLNLLSDPPNGSENLMLQVIHVLTDGTTPSPELITSIKQLYNKLKNALFLIPILSSLTKDEVLPIFPRLVDLPTDKFQVALARILQGSAHNGPALTPAEVLIALHGIDLQREAVSLKKVTEACNACFDQRTVFKQDVLAKVLNQLVEQTPLPKLFMRTVIQAVSAFPSLIDFVMDILIKLVNRQIWKTPQLWAGFLKCATQTTPNSYRVLLQLPTQQLEFALQKFQNLKAPLAAHASQPAVRPSVPRSSQVVLGLIQDVEASVPDAQS